jgi:hypothetical protein
MAFHQVDCLRPRECRNAHGYGMERTEATDERKHELGLLVRFMSSLL